METKTENKRKDMVGRVIKGEERERVVRGV
jgi:hypothetical protein